MGLFSKKVKNEPLRKLNLTANSKGLGEYRCPYCNYLLVEGHVKLIEKPKEERCPLCNKEFLK